MDAFELLKRDHQKVSQLFKEIDASSGQAKTQLFAQLKGELDVHAHIEETVLYPALDKTDEAREITLEAYEEHKIVKDLLAELATSATPDDEWDAKLKVLRENVEHHVEEEEGELFSKARKALSSEEIDGIGAEMEAEKARQQGSAEPTSEKRRAGTAKTKATAKEPETPGVLKRLANLVGLGSLTNTKTASKTKKSRGKRAPAKKSAGKPAKPAAKAAKKGPAKTKAKSKAKSPSKSSSKSASKSARAVTASKTATRGQKRASSGARKTAKKVVKSPGPKKGAARKSTKRSKSK